MHKPAELVEMNPVTNPPECRYLQPLAIGYVSLSTGHVLYMTRIDQTHLEATLFKDLEQRNREHASGLHRKGFDSAAL